MKRAMKEFQAWLRFFQLPETETELTLPAAANDTAARRTGTAHTAWKNQNPEDTSARAMTGIYL
jgi:hypothetical protein